MNFEKKIKFISKIPIFSLSGKDVPGQRARMYVQIDLGFHTPSIR